MFLYQPTHPSTHPPLHTYLDGCIGGQLNKRPDEVVEDNECGQPTKNPIPTNETTCTQARQTATHDGTRHRHEQPHTSLDVMRLCRHCMQHTTRMDKRTHAAKRAWTHSVLESLDPSGTKYGRMLLRTFRLASTTKAAVMNVM
eukprot:m.100329 g.100329  ORF g.100329 m.100329 type:complete len:143 (-) comp10343_c0_seq2:1385-1813(-)